MRALPRWAPFLVFLLLSLTARGQSGVKVELDEVVDNRISAEMLRGMLELRLKLTGNGLDKASAARVIVKEARDDRGNSLTDGKTIPDFFPREYNSGTLQVSVSQPARAASKVKLKGTVELYVPTRDPSAVIKVDKALSKLDTPLSAKALKSAKLEITPLSPGGYQAALKERKIDENEIAKIRAEAKKRGIPEKEVELAIEMAKAMDSIDQAPPDGAVILSGAKSHFDRIYRIEILGADGKPIDVNSRSTSTRGEASMMTLVPTTVPPENAALQFMVITDKSRLSVPFEMSVNLP